MFQNYDLSLLSTIPSVMEAILNGIHEQTQFPYVFDPTSSFEDVLQEWRSEKDGDYSNRGFLEIPDKGMTGTDLNITPVFMGYSRSPVRYPEGAGRRGSTIECKCPILDDCGNPTGKFRILKGAHGEFDLELRFYITDVRFLSYLELMILSKQMISNIESVAIKLHMGAEYDVTTDGATTGIVRSCDDEDGESDSSCGCGDSDSDDDSACLSETTASVTWTPQDQQIQWNKYENHHVVLEVKAVVKSNFMAVPSPQALLNETDDNPAGTIVGTVQEIWDRRRVVPHVEFNRHGASRTNKNEDVAGHHLGTAGLDQHLEETLTHREEHSEYGVNHHEWDGKGEQERFVDARRDGARPEPLGK